jgi:hypothetical protein
MRRLPQFRSVVLLLLGCLGCAGQRTASNGATPAARRQVVLTVENHHWNDVIVYLLHDGVADRLGLATAVKTSTFTIPARRLGMAGVIQLRGHAVGAPDSHTTEAFTVLPSQQIQWTLESDLAHSSIAVH